MLQPRLSAQAILMALACAFLFTASAVAQTVTGAISGTVVDLTNAVLAGATVKVTNEGTGAMRQSATNEAGTFVLVGLPPATYSVAVEMAGFRTYQRTGVVLTANERASLGTVQMDLGPTVETVTVEAEAAVVNTATADTSRTLSSAELGKTMIRGRDFMNLIRLVPGVSQSGGGSDNPGGAYGTFSPSIGGQFDRHNNLTLDGAASGDIHIRSAFSAGISSDAIAELKVMTNTYTSDIGTNPGGTISIITKSGSREFHGSGFYYKRHEQWNANNFFTNRNKLTNPPYRMSVVGLTIGGPLTRGREKLFFFYSGEGSRNFLPSLSNTNFTMPTALERAGDFSQTVDTNGRMIVIRDPLTGTPFAGNRVPTGRIHPQGQALLNVFPQPNFFDTSVSGNAYNYSYNRFEDVPKQSHTLKVDYMPTAKDTLTFRPKRYQSDTKTFSNRYLSNGAPLTLYSYYYTHQDAMVNWTRTVSPSTLNEAQVHFSTARERGRGDFSPITRKTFGITLGTKFPGVNPYDFLPGMTFGGISNPASFTYDARAPMEPGDAVFEVSDNLSYIRGDHTTKFGFYNIKLWASEGPRADNFSGLFNFANDANNPGNANHPFATALLGNYTSYTEATAKGKGLATSTLYEWFAQDQWKVNRRLTMTFGARFSYIKPYQLRGGEHGAALALQNYDPSKSPRLYFPVISGGKRVAGDPVTGATGPAVLIGGFVPGTGDITNGAVTDVDIDAGRYPKGFTAQHGVQVAPRFGFALDLFGSGKTALRGGFGIGKRSLEDSGKMYTIGTNVPYIFTPTAYYGTLDTFREGAQTFYPNRADSFEVDDIVPSVYNWSMGIQHNLGAGMVLDATYVGKVSRHLIANYNANLLPYGTRFLPSSVDPTTNRAYADGFLRPYPEYTSITRRSNSGTSNYNALEVQVNRQWAAGVQFGMAYTWAKAMATGGTNVSNNNPFIPAKIWNRGPTTDDHTFVSSFVWELPNASRRLGQHAFVRGLLDGWELGGIYTYTSGTPRGIGISTTDGYDFSGGDAGVRPNIVGRATVDSPTFNQWFNPASVALPALGTYGNAAVSGLFNGPGINNFDLTLVKGFRITERQNLRLRFEAYNAFNHTQFDGVNTDARFTPAGAMINTQLGQVTSARAPRVMQLGINYSF